MKPVNVKPVNVAPNHPAPNHPAPNRRAKSYQAGALLGVTALAVGGGCNRPSAELQAIDAKALAAPPPPMPGRAPGMMAGSLPPDAQGAAASSVALPPASSAPAVPPPRAPGMMAGSLPPDAQPGAASSGAASSGAVLSNTAPPVAAPTAAPVAAPTATPKAPYDVGAAKAKSKVSMVLATPAGVPPRLVPGTLALKAQLKRLWNKGAAAKHRGDIAGARKAWLAARRLAPQWPGFQESLDKLEG